MDWWDDEDTMWCPACGCPMTPVEVDDYECPACGEYLLWEPADDPWHDFYSFFGEDG